MAVSRPLLLALVGMVLAAATFVTARGAREAASDPASAPAAATITPAPVPAPVKEAGKVASLPPAQPLKSGRFTAKLSIDGRRPEIADGLEVDGRFQSQGVAKPPRFDIDVRLRDNGDVTQAGAVSLGDRAFLTHGAVGYALPGPVWDEVSGVRTKIASFARPGTPAVSGPLGVELSKLLTNAKSRPGPKVDGGPTIEVSGRVDAQKAMAEIAEVQRSAGDAPTFSDSDLRAISRAAGKPRLELVVGRRDGIVRRVRFDMAVTLPPALGARVDGDDSFRVSLNARLSQVNRNQRVTAPTNVSEEPPATVPADALSIGTTTLGVGLVAIDLPGVAEARAAGFKFESPTESRDPRTARPEQKATARQGIPKKVAKALNANRVVVLFLRQPRGADDAATARSVSSLNGLDRVSIFRDGIDRLARYRGVVAELGVAQAPAVVIVGSDRKAQVVEGFVDEGTLRQLVLDAR